MLRPFRIEEGYTNNTYTAQALSGTTHGKHYNLQLTTKWNVDTQQWEIIDPNCECQGFYFRQDCKHIQELIQELKKWQEI